MLVTVVTPSYNQADFLEQTILSVLGQAGDFELEYLVSDGGSADGSTEILKKYARLLKEGSYPIRCRSVSLRWWSERDSGQSEAINKGFAKARGEIVGWLNSDDLYLEGAIEQAVSAFRADADLDLVYANFNTIDAHGKVIERHNVPAYSARRLLDVENIIPQPTVFMRRTTLNQVGLLREDFHYAMDYELWCRFAKAGKKTTKLEQVTASFRLHATSKTQQELNNTKVNRFWPEVYQASRSNGGRLLSPIHRGYLSYLYKPTLIRINIPYRAVRKLRHLKATQQPLIPYLKIPVKAARDAWRLKLNSSKWSIHIEPTPSGKQAILGYNHLPELKGVQQPKRALVSYLVDPLLEDLKGRQLRHFSNQGLGRDVVTALNRLGYVVDVIDWQDKSFVPQHAYDVLVCHGGYNFEQLISHLKPRPKIIHFATGAYWKTHNEQEIARYDYLKQRANLELPYDRIVPISEDTALEAADGIICLGNDWVKRSYSQFKNVRSLNIGLFDGTPGTTKTSEEIKAGRQSFLFYSSWGNVHKGLDIVLDAFAELPDLSLHICTRLSPEFTEAYKDKLYNKANVHFEGFVSYGSEHFHELTRRCLFNIFPSCSEGSPGTIAETAQQGVIPIVTESAGVPVTNFGIILPDYQVEKVREQVQQASQLPHDVLEALSHDASAFARGELSEATFIQNFSDALEDILQHG